MLSTVAQLNCDSRCDKLDSNLEGGGTIAGGASTDRARAIWILSR